MISRARLRANRANGKKSKGPRTKQGKYRSSQNAIKHGLRSKKFAPRFDDHQRDVLVRAWLGRDMIGELLSAAHDVIDAQIALKSIHDVWDQTLATRDCERMQKDEHAKLISRLETLSLYARRARSLQRKAVARYKNASEVQHKADKK